MKNCRKSATLIQTCLVMACLAFTLSQEVAMAAEIDAMLNVMGYDREVVIKINGIHISNIAGGQSEGVLLFTADDPRINRFPAEMRETMKPLFCLKEGENTVEISFKETGKPDAPSRFSVSIGADNYEVPVLEYAQNPEVKEGHAKGTFAVYPKAPAGFKTVVLE